MSDLNRLWPLGTRVRKVKGSSWQGRVVGYYTTSLTPEGYAVESEREPGSVQIYPRQALKKVDETVGELPADLIERTAEAALLAYLPDAIPWPEQSEQTRDTWRRVARAVIPLVLEEADGLDAENARLREALAPFARSGDLLVRAQDNGDFWAYRPAGGDEYGISGKDLLNARAAICERKNDDA